MLHVYPMNGQKITVLGLTTYKLYSCPQTGKRVNVLRGHSRPIKCMLLLHQRHEFQNEEIAATLLLTGSSDRTILVSLLIVLSSFTKAWYFCCQILENVTATSNKPVLFLDYLTILVSCERFGMLLMVSACTQFKITVAPWRFVVSVQWFVSASP